MIRSPHIDSGFLDLGNPSFIVAHQISYNRCQMDSLASVEQPWADVEAVFRQHAADLNQVGSPGARVVAFDGKTLKGSFDNFNDVKAKQVLSAFAVDTALVLAHIEIDEKSNEIPAVQKLLEELDVAGHIVTCDAMHCQKKHSKPRVPRTRI